MKHKSPALHLEKEDVDHLHGDWRWLNLSCLSIGEISFRVLGRLTSRSFTGGVLRDILRLTSLLSPRLRQFYCCKLPIGRGEGPVN
jgi:hypothetical protein